ncbi:MAG: M3 family metallopeptidase [Bacteroidales bacterium]
MKNLTITLLTVLLMITACTRKTEEVNPFMADYNTPFNVPPFDRISEKHYLPAFEEGMKRHNLEIQDIVNNAEEPTFKNTIEALEYSGRLLADVQFVFYNAYSSNTNDEIQRIATEIAPELSLHADNIKLNAKLFERVNAVYAQKENLDLNAEQRKLLEETYKGFVRSGAGLPEEKQNRLKEINQELSVLTLKFGQNVLGETNKFKMIVDNESDLAGLPQSLIDVAAERAAEEGLQGKWIFTLHNSSVMPFLGSADNRELRKVMQQAYINRGNNNNEYDNKETIGKIVNLRLERAKLLGYESHAQYTLEETMVKNTETAMNFVRKVWDAATPIAKREAGEMQTMIKSEGNDFKLAQWDWRYYAEKIRKEKYDFDEEQVRQYFELNTVRSGVFMVVNKLYGLQFKERTDIPKYHPDAQVFEVLEADNSHVGILYMDFYPRESKNSGAWMSSYRDQYIDRNGNYISPVITLVCNFSPPTSTMPSLLTYDEMTTFFHEFGHALHGLLSNVTYPSLSGTEVPRDFVELPSQIMENWANEPSVLITFAKHYQTGEPMPQELIEKIEAGLKFNQGFETVEFLASAFLDLEYHIINEPFADDKIKEVAGIIDQRTISRIGLIPEIYFRHGSTHFQHIFSGGYSAGYYSYIWSGLLDADAYEAFRETGNVFDQATAQSFRKNILEKGGSDDAMAMYINFRGKEPDIQPLLRQRGLIQ